MEIGTWYLILLGLAILIPCIIILDIIYRKIKSKQEYLGLRAIGLFLFFIGLYLWYLAPPPLSTVRTVYGIVYALDLMVSLLGLLLIGSGSIVAIMGPARVDISKRYGVCPVCFSELTLKDEDGVYVNESGEVDEDGEYVAITCTICGGHFIWKKKCLVDRLTPPSYLFNEKNLTSVQCLMIIHHSNIVPLHDSHYRKGKNETTGKPRNLFRGWPVPRSLISQGVKIPPVLFTRIG